MSTAVNAHGDIAKPSVTDEWIRVPGGSQGDVDARIVRPAGATGTGPSETGRARG